MRKKINKQTANMSVTSKNVIGLLLAGIVGSVASIVLSFVFSYALVNSATLSGKVGAFFIASVLSGSFLCGIISSKKCCFKGIVAGALSSILHLFIISSVMLVFSDGKLTSATLFLYLGIIIVSLLGGICGANMKRRK